VAAVDAEDELIRFVVAGTEITCADMTWTFIAATEDGAEIRCLDCDFVPLHTRR